MKLFDMELINCRISVRKVVIPCALGLLCFLHQATAATNTVLDKEFGSGERISVIMRTNTAARGDVQRDYKSAWKVAAVTEMIVQIRTAKIAEVVPVWTNTHYIFSEGDAMLGNHKPLDLVRFRTNLFLCYKEGPYLMAEAIPSKPSDRTRMRFWLARDVSSGVLWTNAVFSVGADDSILLTANGTRDATLTWEFRNGEWMLDIHRSKPELEREMAYRVWCLGSYEGDRWVVKRKHTEPMLKSTP